MGESARDHSLNTIPMFVRILILIIPLVAGTLWSQATAVAVEAPSRYTMMLAEGRPDTGEFRIVFSADIPQSPAFKCSGVNGADPWTISGAWAKRGEDFDLKLNFEYGNPEGKQQRLSTRISVPTGDFLTCFGGLTASPEDAPKRQSLMLLRRSAPDAPPPTAKEIAEAATPFGPRTIAVADGQKTLKLVPHPTQVYLGDVPLKGGTFSGAPGDQNPWQSDVAAQPSSFSMFVAARTAAGEYDIIAATRLPQQESFFLSGGKPPFAWTLSGGFSGLSPEKSLRLHIENSRSSQGARPGIFSACVNADEPAPLQIVAGAGPVENGLPQLAFFLQGDDGASAAPTAAQMTAAVRAAHVTPLAPNLAKTLDSQAIADWQIPISTHACHVIRAQGASGKATLRPTQDMPSAKDAPPFPYAELRERSHALGAQPGENSTLHERHIHAAARALAEANRAYFRADGKTSYVVAFCEKEDALALDFILNFDVTRAEAQTLSWKTQNGAVAAQMGSCNTDTSIRAFKLTLFSASDENPPQGTFGVWSSNGWTTARNGETLDGDGLDWLNSAPTVIIPANNPGTTFYLLGMPFQHLERPTHSTHTHAAENAGNRADLPETAPQTPRGAPQALQNPPPETNP